jgi:hypothetical protein
MRHLLWEQKISAMTDGELKPDETRGVLEHIGACTSCRQFRDSTIALNSSLAALAPKEAPAFKRIPLETMRYYRLVPRHIFAGALKPAYAFAAMAVLVFGAVFVYRVATSPVITSGPLETFLAEGTITIDTFQSARHIVVVTPWASIEPRGTIFTVTQSPARLEVSVARGMVIVHSKLSGCQSIKVIAGELFLMDEKGDFTVRPKSQALPEPDNSSGPKIAIEHWREK